MPPHSSNRKNKQIIDPKQYPPLYRCSAQLQGRVIFCIKIPPDQTFPFDPVVIINFAFEAVSYTIPCAVIAVAQGLSVYAVFAFICILRAYYQRSPFRFYTILHRFRLSVNMQMNRIRCCLRMPHNTSVFRCRLCSNHNTVPMIRLALK